MKWLTAQRGDRVVSGVIEGDAWYALGSELTLTDLVRSGDSESLRRHGVAARNSPAEVVPLDELTALAPLQPTSIRDFLSFLDHLRRSSARSMVDIGKEWHEIPGFYFSNATNIHGPTDPVRVFPGSTWFDLEVEVAAVVGSTVHNAPVEGARHCIAGFMLFCDWSARDIQAHEMKLGLGPIKGKDAANSFGPLFVGVEEFGEFLDGGKLDIALTASINGVALTDGNTRQMDWDFDELISYASRGTTLYPGDVIGTGTVPTGCIYEEYATVPENEFRGWLAPGDSVLIDGDILGRIDVKILEAVQHHRLGTGF